MKRKKRKKWKVILFCVFFIVVFIGGVLTCNHLYVMKAKNEEQREQQSIDTNQKKLESTANKITVEDVYIQSIDPSESISVLDISIHTETALEKKLYDILNLPTPIYNCKAKQENHIKYTIPYSKILMNRNNQFGILSITYNPDYLVIDRESIAYSTPEIITSDGSWIGSITKWMKQDATDALALVEKGKNQAAMQANTPEIKAQAEQALVEKLKQDARNFEVSKIIINNVHYDLEETQTETQTE